MSKEWEKFQADYKKLQPKIKKYSAEEAAAARIRVNSAFANCTQGEEHLADSMVGARKAGVTGDALADFMKNAGFKEAHGLMKTAYAQLADELAAMEAFSKEAAAVQTEVGKLHAAVVKDLKDRKDKSATKKDIEGLQAKLEDDLKGLKTAAGKWAQVEPMKRQTPGNFDKDVAAVVKQAPEAQASSKDNTMLPQLLVDRKLNSNVKHALTLAKTIGDACDDAISMAGDDMAGAAAKVKAAAVQLKELTTLNADYQKIAKDYKNDIEISKDKAKVVKGIEGIEKAWKMAESKVRGAAQTLKKAS